jgi:hypothetical protein
MMTAQLIDQRRTLGRPFTRRIEALKQQVANERKLSAQVATSETQAILRSRLSGRPQNVPPRPGRSHPMKLAQGLVWRFDLNSVYFDQKYADDNVPYWIVQEIGTGGNATLRQGGNPNRRGNPGAGASYKRKVAKQRGRALPASLAWADGPTAAYTAPGASTNQQLYLRDKLKGTGYPAQSSARTPYSPWSQSVRITREIQGKHMVRDGGKSGYLYYRRSVIEAARRAFGGRPYSP